MGSEDSVVEIRTGLFQRSETEREFLERLKTKNKTTKTGESRCLENSPRNKLPVLKAWLMFQGTGPVKQ
jgi:hypothetical protein